jgi:arginine decarboxylase
MAKEKQTQDQRIDQFFTGPGARADHWRFLVDAAKAWSDGSGNRNKFDDLFAQLEVTEEYHGYPGLRLMAALKENAARRCRRLRHSARVMQSLRQILRRASDWDILTMASMLRPTCCRRRLAERSRIALTSSS